MKMPRIHAPDLAAVAGFGLAFLPLGAWYVDRLGDGSDEPLGLVALVLALMVAWTERKALRSGTLHRVIALAFLGAYGVTAWLGWPPLVRALPAMAAVVLWTGLWRSPAATTLLGLSLPVMATMQFYLGYPMRLAAAAISSASLKLLSLPVQRIGTQLMYEGATLGVDAPCSGVRMLWMSCFFGAVLAGLLRLGWIAGGGLMASAMLAALLANSVRATVLFFPEAGLVELPSWCHEGAGLLLHVVAMAGLLALARRLQASRPVFS
jgi:exosortase/archaeosortase family protein